MPDIIITPSSGIVDFYPISSGARVGRIDGSGTVLNLINPSGYISASGSGLSINTSSPNAVLHAYSPTSGSTIFNAEGTNGILFSVIDSMSGSLFSVNTIAGLPALEVLSDYSLKAGRYNQNDFVVSSGGSIGIGTGTPTAKLHVSNDIKASEIDFVKIGDNTTLATITLNNSNDLSITAVSGDVIFGDQTQDIYIGNGINEVDIVFEQNGEIRPLSGKTITIGTSGAFTNILANKIGINQNSFSNIPLDIYSSTTGATVMNIAGTNGSLFSVTDNLSGSLMSVNNNAGLPVFEVFSDDRVIGGRFGQNDWIITSGGNIGIGTGVPNSKFHVVGTSTFNGDVSSTGSIIAGSGSAGNPSFEFSGDTDTGMFTPSGNIIGFATSGVERVRIDNIGNIGIGTTSPTANLSVTGNAVFGQTGSSIGATVSVKRIGNNYNLELVGATDGVTNFAVQGASTNMLWTSRANYFDIQTNSAGKGLALTTNGGSLFLSSTGNVGIGTTTPTSQLHVVGSGNVTSGLTTNGLISNLSSNFYLNNNFGNTFSINYGTNVSPYGTVTIIPSGTNPGTTNIVSQINGTNTLYLPSSNGNIALISDINTTQITGILSVSKGGTNTSTYSNGQLLIGSGTSLIANTLTAGTGISITNGSGTITINTSGLQTTLNNPTTGTGTGTSTSGYLSRWTSSSGLSNSAIYQNQDNIGIGTLIPSNRLHVVGTGFFTSGLISPSILSNYVANENLALPLTVYSETELILQGADIIKMQGGWTATNTLMSLDEWNLGVGNITIADATSLYQMNWMIDSNGKIRFGPNNNIGGSSTYSSILGGSDNTIRAGYGSCFGKSNTLINSYQICHGYNNNLVSQNNYVIGSGNSINANNSIILGHDCKTSDSTIFYAETDGSYIYIYAGDYSSYFYVGMSIRYWDEATLDTVPVTNSIASVSYDSGGDVTVLEMNDGVYVDNVTLYFSVINNLNYITAIGKEAKSINHGEFSHSAGKFSSEGDAQHSVLVARASTISQTFTVTIASPAVFTLANHGLTSGNAIAFGTTGALPTGLTAGTTYYVISTGLTANTFRVSAVPNGSAINTSGTQSGIHKLVKRTNLLLDGSSSQITIPTSTCWVFEIRASTYCTGNNVGGWWIFRGGIRNDNYNSTTLVGNLITENGLETAINSASLTVSAGAGALSIVANGVPGKDMRWVATIDLTQVSY